MPTVGLVTSRLYPELTEDDRLVLDPLRAAGVEAVPLAWDDPEQSWRGLEAVVMRSPGTYWTRLAEFTAWLARVEKAGPPLWNQPEVLRWNAHKSYLRDLASRGVAVTDAAWIPAGDPPNLAELLAERGWHRAVVKPVVSAAAYRTTTVAAAGAFLHQAEFEALASDGEVMVQPFLDEIVTEGEWSFVFFNGEISHVFLKKPAPGDFRVQTYFGGTLVPTEPPPELLAQARAVLDHVPDLLYARVDGIRRGDSLVLVELEVFEPVLYLRLDPRSPDRFAQAISSRLP